MVANGYEAFKQAVVSIVKATNFIVYMVVDSAFVASEPRETNLDLVCDCVGDNQVITMQIVDLDAKMDVVSNELQHAATSYVRVINDEVNV